MKSQLIAIVAAVLLLGCGELQQSVPPAEVKPETPTAKAPDISIHDLHATILHLLGIDHKRLTYRHQGRDFRLTDVYHDPALKIFA